MDRENLRIWVAQARTGDEQAFGRLVEATWARLVAFLRTVLADRYGEAEDTAQEAYHLAWQALPRLKEDRAFVAWLRRIALRQARRQAKRPRLVSGLVGNRGSNLGIAELGSQRSVEAAQQPPNQLDGDVARALSRLSSRQRAVLHLGELEGLTDEEIGASLGIRASTVRVHRQRGRQRLRELLEGGKADG